MDKGPLAGSLGASAQSAALQRQRALQQRVDSDVNSLVDNFANMVKAARVNDPVRNAQEAFQIEVHAAKVVNAAESLLKLVSELKQTAVFANAAVLNRHMATSKAQLEAQATKAEEELFKTGKKTLHALKDLERPFYAKPRNVDQADSYRLPV